MNSVERWLQWNPDTGSCSGGEIHSHEPMDPTYKTYKTCKTSAGEVRENEDPACKTIKTIKTSSSEGRASKDQAPAPKLDCAVCFDVPGAGDVWLVPDEQAAERLNLPAGCWLTPGDLALLEPLEPEERLEVLRWMRETGGRLVAAPAPARRWGRGEAGWQRWRLANLDEQIAAYRAARR